MKKLNRKLISSIILGLILYTPITNVYATELNDGAIYGINDNYSSYRKLDTNGNLVYDFYEDSSLEFNTTGTWPYQQNAIYINESNQNNIIINNKLDINFTNSKGSINGISINSVVQDKTIDRSKGGNIIIHQDNPESATVAGVKASGKNNSILLGDSQIDINVKNPASNGEVYGLYIISGQENNITMGNGDIVVNAEGDGWIFVEGIAAYNNNNIKTGNINLRVSSIINTGELTYIRGIEANSGAHIETGKSNIDVVAKGAETVSAIGVLSALGSTVDLNITNVNVKTIGGSTENGASVQSIGLYSGDNSEINYAGGSINAKADKADAYVAAVKAGSNSNININKGTNNTVVINGNLDAINTGKIFLNLNTPDSVLNGHVLDENGTFNLTNNAKWNVTDVSKVNEFNIDNGKIYMNTDSSVNIKNYSGNGTVSFKAEDTASNGVMVINTGNFEINNATKGSDITLNVANSAINTLDINKTEDNLNALAKKVFYNANDGNLNGKVVIKEGLITPAASGDLSFDTNDRGYVTNITGGNRTTETMYAMKNLAATAIVSWRQEDNTLSQRLGELRNSEDGQGIWVRMSRGEFEYDREYKNQYNFFQMGYDWAIDNWHYGAAISHNDGQTTYTYGNGENRSTSLSLYGTWLGDKGHYADVVLKQGRLHNNFDIYTSAGHTNGDYDSWGTSISGEYGKKIVFENNWYVTPQVQLSLMRINGEDYTTNNGINIHQDTLHSAVGRIGFELGKKIDDKGNIYAKASLLHDFAGNAETYLSYNGIENSYSQDISDTWCEAGIGFNYKTSDNSYIYADVVKTFGGNIKTPWQWNAGMRWNF